MRRLALLAAGLAVLLALSVPSAVGARGESPQSASLSFVRGPSILLVSRDGSSVTTVLRGTGSGPIESQSWYYDPAWSNDGSRLAVTVGGYPTGTHWYADVFVTRPGKPRLRISGFDSISGSPSWAPDGGRVVLVVYEFDTGGGLNIRNLGSGATAELTPIPGAVADESTKVDDMPAWSPDGSKIAFARETNHQTKLFLIRPKGSGLEQVTNDSAWNPSWSPDSKRLVFDDGHRIAVVDADGRDLRYLTKPAARDADPAWSPDGRTIAFVRYRSAKSETGDIWVMSPNGGSLKLLVKNAGQPAWKRG